LDVESGIEGSLASLEAVVSGYLIGQYPNLAAVISEFQRMD
jgi:hypothetical protein